MIVVLIANRPNLWSLLIKRKRTVIGEWVWIWMLAQCHWLKYSLNKQVRLWGRRMDPSSAHTRGPNSVTLLSPPHSSQTRGLKCRWMTEDCVVVCCADGWFTDNVMWAAGYRLEVWECKRQRPGVSRGVCALPKTSIFVTSLLVCTWEWMVKCGISSRASCELWQLHQRLEWQPLYPRSFLGGLFWQRWNVLTAQLRLHCCGPIFFLTPPLRSLICQVLILNRKM